MSDIQPGRVGGELSFAGDKSLSHRAAIFAALAKGRSSIENFLTAQDTINTLKAMEAAGVQIEGDISSGAFDVISPGLAAMQGKNLKIDVGNSGTGARLLMGLFSGIPDTTAVIDGDDSLRKRPMGRVSAPLASAGAIFDPADKLPIEVRGKKLLPILFREELGSAQVKSAMMLAALASGVSLRLEEPIPSRDHTENMLGYAGVELLKEPHGSGFIIEMEPPYELQPQRWQVWGDISSASFFVVLALLMKEGKLTIKNVLLNPYRDRYIKVLQEMGGKIQVIPGEKHCGEAGGDIIVEPSRLHGVEIKAADIPAVIDELPILTIAGLFAEGRFGYRNAAELRVKESDRISAMVDNLKELGVDVEEYDDGLSLTGLSTGRFDSALRTPGYKVVSHMDHRIVMSFQIADLVSRANGGAPIEIDGKEWVATSFPDFYTKLGSVLSS